MRSARRWTPASPPVFEKLPILSLQLTVAWAGERACDPKRLDWWNTDLTDAAAGGDLFSRLLPKTGAWAGLAMAREAALRVDAAARARLSTPDRVQTLFHFGFELDEALEDRLQHHKRRGTPPEVALEAAWGVTRAWSESAFNGYLVGLGPVRTEATPAGRRLKGGAKSPADTARALAAALLPFTPTYPLPFTEATPPRANND